MKDIKETTEKKPKRSAKTPNLLRGFSDILPENSKYWRKFRDTSEKILDDYSYGEIVVPILEQMNLFKRTIGEHTDIVAKEMFTFKDKGGDTVAMRPEITAGIARSYVTHGMLNRSRPVKLFSIGPTFRYDRPQAGRFRQFNQLSIEIFGDESAVADAEVIFISYLICKKLGLDVVIQINSLGDTESRQEYITILKEYFRSKRRLLCEDCKARLTKNTLRLLDCKEEQCRELALGAPQLVDHLDEESKNHFVAVLEHLDESEVPYELNPHIVRGLDYYNRTAFEIVPVQSEGEESATVNAIGGGGRYDGLVEIIGGRETPAVGMAFGIERVVQLLKEQQKNQPSKKSLDVFLAQLGEEATKRSFILFEKLRESGIKVRANFSKDGLKQQLEIADRLGAVFAVILGQKELLDGTVIIRDMENGIQEVVDLEKICDELKKRLKKGK
jgi:histidyl-tRNA synthetase